MIILVTGSSGFIGSSICKYGYEQGYDIRGLRRSKPYSAWDIRSPDLSLPNADFSPELEGVEVVIHSAGLAHNRSYTHDQFYDVNVSGTYRLADQAIKAGVKKFIYLSSIGVNGAQSYTPFTEIDLPRPLEAYSMSKYLSENALLNLASNSNMNVTIVRFPMVYGPNAPGSFDLLTKLVKMRIPLPFKNVVRNSRSFLSICNLVEFIYRCIDLDDIKNEIYLLADNERYSTKDFIAKVAKLYNLEPYFFSMNDELLSYILKKVGKSYLENSLFGSLEVDISKVIRDFGWAPRFSFDSTFN